MSTIAIILASGTGARFGSETPKQFLKLAGKMVFEHTLDTFQSHPLIDEIIVVIAPSNRLFVEDIVTRNHYEKVSKIINGGSTRQESSAAGINAVQGDHHKVLVHDAARPLLNDSTINRCIHALDKFDAVDTAIPSPDTVIYLDENQCISNIPERSKLRLGQTPQAFKSGLLRQAHALAKKTPHLNVTDDCGLILHFDLAKIYVVDGDVSNIKITYPSDIYLADRLFQLRTIQPEADDKSSLNFLANKVIVVFGASRGIGESISKIATEKGAHVIAVSRSSGVNITDPKTVKSTLQQAQNKYGKIDAVINTAGILRTGLLAGQDQSDIDEMISINLQGSIIVAREAFEFMKNSGSGSIFLFTSSSYTRGRALSAVYSATKAAIVNLTQGLAQEYAPYKVKINAINPERTATPMRFENFGNEPDDILLKADKVATVTLNSILNSTSGQVIDVKI